MSEPRQSGAGAPPGAVRMSRIMSLVAATVVGPARAPPVPYGRSSLLLCSRSLLGCGRLSTSCGNGSPVSSRDVNDVGLWWRSPSVESEHGVPAASGLPKTPMTCGRRGAWRKVGPTGPPVTTRPKNIRISSPADPPEMEKQSKASSSNSVGLTPVAPGGPTDLPVFLCRLCQSASRPAPMAARFFPVGPLIYGRRSPIMSPCSGGDAGLNSDHPQAGTTAEKILFARSCSYRTMNQPHGKQALYAHDSCLRKLRP